MSEATGQSPAMNSSRQWTALPDNDLPLEWSMDPYGPFLQGPLDMAFLRGKKIFLNLEQGQVALLTGDNTLQAIFLEGGHVLDVGPRPGQVSSASSLIFLAVDQLLSLRWTHGNPLDLPGPTKCHLIGSCSLAISSPSRFHDQFLRPVEIPDCQTIVDAMEKTARQILSEFLTGTSVDGVCDSASLQSTLMNLGPEAFSEDLADHGLACTQLALYTAQPPVESETENSGSRTLLDIPLI